MRHRVNKAGRQTLPQSKSPYFVLKVFIYLHSILLAFQCLAIEDDVSVVTEILPPLQFYNQQGHPTGAMVELVEATLAQAKIKGKVAIFPWARSYQMSLTQPNTLIFSIMRNQARERKFNWLGEIYQAKVYLIKLKSRKGLLVKTIKDAMPHKIGVVRLDISQEYLLNRGFELNVNTLPSPTYDHLWAQLYSRKVDFILANEFMWQLGHSHPNLKGEAVEIALALNDFPSSYFLATSLNSSPIVTKKLTESLEILKKNGQYQAILAKWQL